MKKCSLTLGSIGIIGILLVLAVSGLSTVFGLSTMTITHRCDQIEVMALTGTSPIAENDFYALTDAWSARAGPTVKGAAVVFSFDDETINGRGLYKAFLVTDPNTTGENIKHFYTNILVVVHPRHLLVSLTDAQTRAVPRKIYTAKDAEYKRAHDYRHTFTSNWTSKAIKSTRINM